MIMMRTWRSALQRSVGTFVAARALETLVALLRLDRERGDRTGFEALQRDRLAGVLAVAIGALVYRLQRLVDLGDQLAEPVAGAQFEGAVGIGGRPTWTSRLGPSLFPSCPPL